jgi:hypothetical protein
VRRLPFWAAGGLAALAAAGAEAQPLRPLPRPETRPPPQTSGWTLRDVPGEGPAALGIGPGEVESLVAFCLAGTPFLALRFRTPPDTASVDVAFAFPDGTVEATAGFEETAGDAYVIALTGSPLAARLAGSAAAVAMNVDGAETGTLSLDGSSHALHGALAPCHDF